MIQPVQPVPPVEPSGPRPRWSVMIPTYHCASYLRETLQSVLAQDPGPDAMQIEVVDDHSTDDPEAVVRDVGGDRVSFHRQPENVGHVANFDTCLARARGHLVHLLHGDDAVRPGFYEAMGRAFDTAPEIGAAYCRYIAMDERGRWTVLSALERPEAGVVAGWLDEIATGQRLQTPSMVVRRSVYEHLGGFDRRVEKYGEDWEMWVRIAAHYPVWHEPEPLALYRIHTSSLSGETVRSGANMRDLARVIKINRTHLPPDRADALTQQAKRNNALAALRRATRSLKSGDSATLRAQVREAVRMSRSPQVLAASGAVLALAAGKAVGLPTSLHGS